MAEDTVDLHLGALTLEFGLGLRPPATAVQAMSIPSRRVGVVPIPGQVFAVFDYPDREFVQDWSRLLLLPPCEIRSKLTSRDPDMYRLRLSSPLVLCRHIRRVAVRVAERRTFQPAAQLAAGF